MAQQKFKQQLLDQKQALIKLITLTKTNTSAVTLDQSMVGRLSRMDAIQKQAMSQEVNRRRQRELARITAALKRLEDDEFGYCISCGEDIEPERLASNPSLPQCHKCATE